MSYTDLVNADLRLSILLALDEPSDYTSNEYVLHRMLDLYGCKCSRDQLLTQLAWLQEQGLVKLRNGAILIATMTARGADVAEGRTTAPGVQRRAPKD